MTPLPEYAEALLWIVVVSRLITHSHTPLAFLGYAAGFAREISWAVSSYRLILPRKKRK
ncbi:MAG: hypothetical protein N2Z84_01920 [Atribacterota bacterium]|nr:hypothetical protein [Atribacterota bacterium]